MSQASSTPDGPGAAPGADTGRPWYYWVEDALVVAGTLALLAVAFLRWRSPAWDVVLWVDLAVMAAVFGIRLRRFARGLRSMAASRGAGPDGRGRP